MIAKSTSSVKGFFLAILLLFSLVVALPMTAFAEGPGAEYNPPIPSSPAAPATSSVTTPPSGAPAAANDPLGQFIDKKMGEKAGEPAPQNQKPKSGGWWGKPENPATAAPPQSAVPQSSTPAAKPNPVPRPSSIGSTVGPIGGPAKGAVVGPVGSSVVTAPEAPAAPVAPPPPPFDSRLLLDVSDVAILVPGSMQQKFELADVANKMWLETELDRVLAKESPLVSKWQVVGFRLNACPAPCQLRVIVTAQPPRSSLSLIDVVYDLPPAEARALALSLQKNKYEFEKKRNRTLDGFGLGVSPYLTSDGASDRLSDLKNALHDAISAYAPSGVVFNTTLPGATADAPRELVSRVFMGLPLEDLTAPKPAQPPAVDVAAPGAPLASTQQAPVAAAQTPVVLPMQTIPEHLQALREVNRRCTGNRIAGQLKMLGSVRDLPGYSTFSRELPYLCDNLRQFGYSIFNSPVVSAEVVLQAAQAAKVINRTFIEKQANFGPGRDCVASQSEVAMCHFMKSPNERCMGMCSDLKTFKVNWVQRQVNAPPPRLSMTLPVIPQGGEAGVQVQPQQVPSQPQQAPQPQVPQEEPKYEWVPERPMDLAMALPDRPIQGLRFLNIACVASEERAGGDPTGLTLAASIELQGSMVGSTDIRYLAARPMEGNPSMMQVNPERLKSLNAPRLAEQLRDIGTPGRGSRIELQFPYVAPPATPQPTVVIINSEGQSSPMPLPGPAPAPTVGVIQGEAFLDLRCQTHQVRETVREERTVKSEVAAPRRQSDVYSGVSGRDGSGRNTGILGDDAIDARVRSMASGQSAPRQVERKVMVDVEKSKTACASRYTAELNVFYPMYTNLIPSAPTQGGGQGPMVVAQPVQRQPGLTLKGLTCSVSESGISY